MARQPQLGNFQVRHKELPGPFVLRICPQKFPEVALAAPVLASWSKESTFGSQQAPYSRVSRSSVNSQELYFLSIWGLFYRISQFVLYLSGVPCWRAERVVGLPPNLWTSLFVSLDASISLCFVCLEKGRMFQLPLKKVLWGAFWVRDLIIALNPWVRERWYLIVTICGQSTC